MHNVRPDPVFRTTLRGSQDAGVGKLHKTRVSLGLSLGISLTEKEREEGGKRERGRERERERDLASKIFQSLGIWFLRPEDLIPSPSPSPD